MGMRIYTDSIIGLPFNKVRKRLNVLLNDKDYNIESLKTEDIDFDFLKEIDIDLVSICDYDDYAKKDDDGILIGIDILLSANEYFGYSEINITQLDEAKKTVTKFKKLFRKTPNIYLGSHVSI